MRHIFIRTTSTLLLLFTVALLGSCLDDDDTVDIDLSTLRGELAMLHFDANHQLVSFTNDSDETFYFATYYQYTAYTADSTYRALVYYCDAAVAPYVELYAFSDVFVTNPVAKSAVAEMKTDPVYFQSAWFSDNKTYLNIVITALYYSSSASQTLFLVRDVNEENGKTRLTLYHDQNDVPEYYSGDVYISVPLKENFTSGEEIEFVVNTYDSGEVIKEYTVPNF